MNPFNTPTTNKKNPFAATPLGIATNTVLGLPQAAIDVGRDIAQGIARSAGSAGLTLAKPLGGVDKLQATDLKNPFSQQLFKAFFGDQPIQPIEDNIATAELAIKQSPFAQKYGLDKAALPLAFGGVFGSTALDLTPFGGLEKNAAKELLYATTKDGAAKILEAMKVPQEAIAKFAQHFADATTPAEVQDGLDIIKGIKGVEEKVTPLEETKQHLSFLEDAMADHPGRGLLKYRSSATGALPEVSTKAGSGKFNTKGDSIYQDLIGQDASQGGSIDLANEHLQAYLKLRGQAVEMKAQVKTLEAEQKATQRVVSARAVGGSTVDKANQAHSTLPVTIRAEVPTLEKIVRQTSVKDKVNGLDYMRTPDRVLEKIGFGNESKMVREGYEGYVKELPKNIDKVTEWSRRVPKESAKSIFQYLDGEKVTLNVQEAHVATEIKTWLKEWATRLHLPEDKTITNYITHIFDQELVNKEFDEDLAKIITDKIPGSVYDPFLERRLGAKGYKQNVWEALDAYVKRATRKVHMDPALEAIKAKAGTSLERSNIEASQFKYLQRYVSGINMRPTELDNLLDNSIKSVVGYKYGQRPVTQLTKTLRQMTYRGLLGLNPGSALRNISQGINTYAVLGEKYTTIGYAKLLSRNALKEVEAEGVYSPGFIQDRNLSSTKKALERIDKGLFLFFDGAEKINRAAAYLGAKSKALGMGKSEAEAVDYAKGVVRKTQFSFGSVDTPVALQSDIVKTLAQFQNYTAKQTEFLAEMVKDKNFVGLLRYGVAGMAFVYSIGKAFGMTPKDLIPSARLGTPPSLKLPVEAGKALLNVPDKYGKPRSLGQKVNDVADSAIGLVPGGSQIKKSVQGANAFSQGKDTTATGRTRYVVPQDMQHFLQAVLFGKSALPEAKAYYNKLDNPTKSKSKKNPFNI